MKEKSFERKNELLEAALDEFVENSYENASLNAIIKNAGISKGTFYYHFQDKQALYLFLLEKANKTKWKFINNHENLQKFKEKDIFDKFKLQAQIGIEFATMYPKYHRLSIMFTKEKGNKIYEDAKNVLGIGTESIMEEMVKKAMENSDFNNRFSIDFIVKIMSHLFMNFDEIFSTDEDFKLEKMLENLDNYVNFMKYGLGK